MDEDFEIELKKLNNMLRVLLPALAGYLGLGTIVYSIVEKWSLFDSLYFSVVTVATVGYGDMSPHTVLGKIFTMFYVFVGIGLFIYVANTFLKQRALAQVKKRYQKRTSKKQ